MSSWRMRAVLGSWWMCGGVSLLACSSSDEPATTVPAFGQTPPAMPAPIISTPEVSAPAMSEPVAPAANGAPATTPSVQQPGSEGIGDGLPIDPDTSGNTNEGGNGGVGDGEQAAPTPAAGEPAPLAPITIWLAGDSTVANGNSRCSGWGGVFAPHFNDLVSVRNSAAGGRSVHTWLYEVHTIMDEETGECALNRDAAGEPVLQARWQDMLDNMKAGDYLFIQFGINDGSRTCDRHVGIDAFHTAYGMMAKAAKDRGAHPIFVTPVSMIRCDANDDAIGSRGAFVPATVEAGQEFDVPVIELHARSVELFQSLAFCPIPGGDVSATTTGPVGDFFCDDHTHFSPSGAVGISDLVARALVEQNIPLAAYLR